MANLKKTLDSGAELDITLASFAEGNKLLKAIMKEIEAVKISSGLSQQKSFKDFLNIDVNDGTINTIKNIVSGILSSDAVEEALWPCMSRATYNSKRVTRDLFEDEEVRKDYLIVAKEVLFYNLLPFFGNLASLLKNTQAKVTDTQK